MENQKRFQRKESNDGEFENIKIEIDNKETLALPGFNSPFIFRTVASNTGS